MAHSDWRLVRLEAAILLPLLGDGEDLSVGEVSVFRAAVVGRLQEKLGHHSKASFLVL